MASAAYVEALAAGMAKEDRRIIRAIFDYVLSDIRIGRPTPGEKQDGNVKVVVVEGTTPSTANEEFSIEHGMEGVAPYLAIPILGLQTAGSEVVRLRVERVADTRRVYLSSADTDKSFLLLLEG